MNCAVEHRGPDGEGEYYWRNVGLGHRRLAILDLSAGGRQPMRTTKDDLVIVFNGEIYNYLELRAELEEAGHAFRSHSDTEVILASYITWGSECVSRFNGMWAFAILDKGRNCVFCSRDRFGVKPFYYTESSKYFAFGSEIRQLLPFLPRRMACKTLVTDFLLTSICDHTNGTFFEDIQKLPAGHNLSYDLGTGRFSISRYYRISRHDDLLAATPDEAVAAFGSVLQSAVDLRLRADVPVGTCLSGGLDSSAVASLASPRYRKQSGRPFCAITAVSEQESNDESGFASLVATAGGMKWCPVKPTYGDFADSLPSVVQSQEEPFGSPSIVMQYFVMKMAREQKIPVLLDGQGGDETLLGYPKYYASYLAAAWRENGVPGFLRACAVAGRNHASMSFLNSMKYLTASFCAPMRYRFYGWRQRYLTRIPPLPQHLADFSSTILDCFALQELEITRTNLPALLRYEDKNSMAHSIETRLPFLDYRVVETALSLPGNVKIRGGWSKWVLRQSMDGLMPDAVTWRKSKLGFEAPEKTWLERHKEQMQGLVFQSPLLKSISDPGRFRSVWKHLDRRSQWRLFSLALWEESFGLAA